MIDIIRFEGKTYQITSQAQPENFKDYTGTTTIRYVAYGLAPNGNSVLVIWDMLPEWKSLMASYDSECWWQNGEPVWDVNEEDACDWQHPTAVIFE